MIRRVLHLQWPQSNVALSWFPPALVTSTSAMRSLGYHVYVPLEQGCAEISAKHSLDYFNLALQIWNLNASMKTW